MLLGNGPMTLELGALRSRTDFSGDLKATQQGSTTRESQTLGLRFVMPQYPVVSASASRSWTANEFFGGLRSTSDTNGFSLSAAQVLSALDYRANYDSDRTSGSLADTNYRSHRLEIDAGTRPADGVELRATNVWLQRVPTVEDPSNPLFDGNAFTATGSWTPSRRFLLTGTYSDGLFTIARAGSNRLDRHTQAASQGLQWTVAPAWTVVQSLALSRSDDRLADQRQRADGQSLTGGLRYVRSDERDRFQLEGTASAGLLQPEGGGSYLGYGAGADAQYVRSELARRWTASYRVNWERNLQSQQGWRVVQALRGSVDLFAGPGLRAQVTLDANHSLANSDLFGGTETRFARLSVVGRYQRVQLNVAAGVSEGLLDLVPGLGGGVPGGVADTVKNRSLFAQASAETAFGRTGFSGRLQVNWLQTSNQGRALLEEVAVSGLLSYAVGLFTFSIEDRYSVGSVNYGVTTLNSVFVRATRAFGSGM